MFIGAIVFLRVIGGIDVLCILVSIEFISRKRKREKQYIAFPFHNLKKI